MREVLIKPILEIPSEYDDIEYRIQENWKQELYLPLVEMLGASSNVLQNAKDDVNKAIRSGKIKFYRGQFTGRFNSTLSRELRKLGAVWDRKQGCYKIPYGSLPTVTKEAIAYSEAAFERTLSRLNKYLNDILPEKIAEKVKLADLFDRTIYKVDGQISESLKAITVQPKLTAKMRAEIAEGYSNNLKLYIKDWTENEIKTLRKTVQKSTLNGVRYESMIKDIQDRYGVSQNKAKFLAKQETSIMMAEFKKTRYMDAGSDEYIWRCVSGSPAHPVRPMHKKLDGTRQKWSNPPVVNEKGDRKNCGCDYGCRCYPQPVVKFK